MKSRIKRKKRKMTVSVCEMDHIQIEVAVDDGRKEAETEYYKHLAAEFTPCVGQQFFEIDEAVTFYKIYTLPSGFDVRKYSTKKWRDGEIKSKLLVCNREGFTYVPKGEAVIKKNETGIREEEMQWGIRTAKQRKYTVKRVGCKAHVRLFMKNGVLVIDRFHMGHNHELVSSEDRQFQKMSRNIEDFHKYLIMYNSRLRIGATRTYNMYKELVNGFENIGASLTDFKNFHRDVKCFIHKRDGQLFIDRFKNMAQNRQVFYFDYEVDKDNRLRRTIWADRTARRNYSVFGDAVSYDPTYSTNKYDMIFTPFTGIDHHKRSVTFCGAC